MADLRCPYCHTPLALVPLLETPATAGSVRDLHKAAAVYSTEQRVTGAWSAQWAPTAEAHLRRFVESGLKLDRTGVGEWKQSLLADGKSPRTVNSHLATLGAFCQWLLARGELFGDNPARGHTLRSKKVSAADERLAFEPAEVQALLEAVAGAPHVGYSQLVWFMAYTGARNEEVAQLRRGDVRQQDGIWVFDLTTMDEGQRRKTSASRRLVPVHTRLQGSMGMQVRQPSEDPAESLLGLQEQNGRWAYSASRWVNDRVLPKLKKDGVVRDDKRLTLYSLRHSVTTQLKHKGIPEDLLAELVGHTNSSMTTGRYGKRYPVGKLKEVVELIEW